MYVKIFAKPRYFFVLQKNLVKKIFAKLNAIKVTINILYAIFNTGHMIKFSPPRAGGGNRRNFTYGMCESTVDVSSEHV